MKTFVALGGASCRIADQLATINPAYSTFKIDYDPTLAPDFLFRLSGKVDEERLESEFQTHQLKTSFGERDKPTGFIVCGGGKISSCSLRVLEALSDKTSVVLYYTPDPELLSMRMRTLEKATFGVLQEYARSAVFDRIILISGKQIEQYLQNVSYTQYYQKINEAIATTVNMINLLNYQTPVFETHDPEGVIAPARISTVGTVDLDTGAECLFYPVESPREKVYYFLVGKNELQNNQGLMTSIRSFIRGRITPQIDVTYRIYEAPFEGVSAYCVANASLVQKSSGG